MMRFTTLALISAVLLFSSPSYAILTSASVSPPTSTANASTAAPVPLTWTVMRAGAPGSVTVVSSQINFLLNGAVVASTSKMLSKTMNAVNNVDVFIFSEVVNIPRSVLTQAVQAGQTVTVERSFEEVNVVGTQTATANIAMTGGLGGNLAVTRIDLTFDDGSVSCTGSAGVERTAIARIRADGIGLLRGSWQVREGGALGSYRILRTIQVPVNGTGYTQIRSPRLPTVTGAQRLDVKLVVDSPALAFRVPEISCSISGSDTSLQKPVVMGDIVKLIAPQGPVILNADTKIRWEKAPKAKAYRIEILSDLRAKPAAVQMAKKDQAEAALSPLTLQKLNSNAHYMVRVVAE